MTGAPFVVALAIVVGTAACSEKPARAKACDAGMLDAAVALDPSTADVHVSPQGADTTVCGPPAVPCKTVQHGIDRARATGARVHVAAGEYEETVRVYEGTDVEGAGASDVIVRSPARANAVVVATDLDGAATLAGLTLRAHDARGGASSYGAIVRGKTSTLHLRDVNVDAGRGGDGAHGEDGIRAYDDDYYSTDVWRDGKAGAHGAPGDTGHFGPTGYSAASAGQGSRGEDGARGSPGGAGDCKSCYRERTSCSSGRQRSCATYRDTAGSICGGEGAAGTGGSGGTEGLGGAGGGGSIALYVWDAVVSIEGGSLTSSDGGAGGTGGNGGAGDEGKTGTAGESRTCSGASGTSSGGNAGGRGGHGGRGGRGGGGAGGPSFAIYRGGTARVTVSGARLTYGAAGTGAQGATSGTAAEDAP